MSFNGFGDNKQDEVGSFLTVSKVKGASASANAELEFHVNDLKVLFINHFLNLLKSIIHITNVMFYFFILEGGEPGGVLHFCC